MNKHMILGGGLTGLMMVTGAVGMVSAQSVATSTGLTEEQVIAIALEEVPGEVQEVELEQHRGEQIFEIDILALDGTEMEVEIAAATGDVLKIKAEGEGCDKDKGDRDDRDDSEEEA